MFKILDFMMILIVLKEFSELFKQEYLILLQI
jgi:hypothetical protein